MSKSLIDTDTEFICFILSSIIEKGAKIKLLINSFGEHEYVLG